MVVPTYYGIPLKDLNPELMAIMTAKAGVVIIRDSGATPEEYAEWSLGLGYHLSPEIWCTDKEHSNLFTNCLSWGRFLLKAHVFYGRADSSTEV